MGWSFRKSASLGPFRLNFSKSGVGLSFGVKGARINMSRRGTYVNIGSNGIYYRHRINQIYSSMSNAAVPPAPENEHYSNGFHTITTDNVESVTDVDSKEFINELESKDKKISFLKIFGIWPALALVIYAILFCNQVVRVDKTYQDFFIISKKSVNIRSSPSTESLIVHKAREFEKYTLTNNASGWVKIYSKETLPSGGFVRADMGNVSHELLSSKKIKRIQQLPWLQYVLTMLVVSSLIWCIYLNRLDKKRKTLEIYYTLDKDIEILHKKFLEFFSEFASSKRVWQKLHASGISDKKYFAGASELITRVPVGGISTHKLPSRFLRTNISIPFIALKNTEMYFFPERIILKRGNKFGGTFYKNIRIGSTNIQFIEEQVVPSDAQVIDYTWKYLNKNGGPDRRFNNNRKLPICLYTNYTFESEGGIEEVITTSKAGSMDNFAEFIKIIGKHQVLMDNGKE
ncbi:MAG: DUF4236 domain-containing protein [Bacteroidota bacterium]